MMGSQQQQEVVMDPMLSQVGRCYSWQTPELQGLAACGTWGLNRQRGLKLTNIHRTQLTSGQH